MISSSSRCRRPEHPAATGLVYAVVVCLIIAGGRAPLPRRSTRRLGCRSSGGWRRCPRAASMLSTRTPGLAATHRLAVVVVSACRDLPRTAARSGSRWTAVVYMANVYLELTVTRTQIYLTDEQRDSLGSQSARTGRPMSELIREALDEYLRRHRKERRQEVLRSVAGLWADRTDLAQLDDARATLDRDRSP